MGEENFLFKGGQMIAAFHTINYALAYIVNEKLLLEY